MTQLLNAACIAGLAAIASDRVLEAQLPQAVGTWSAQGSMADARTGAASVVLGDGRTLILSGQRADGSVTDSVIAYDPVANGVTSAGQLFAPRVNAAAARLEDGRVVVSGGQVGGAASADVEIFDPVAGTSTFAATMAAPRAWHASSRLADGRVLIVGGATADGTALATAEIFDPQTSSVAPAGTMATARMGLSATTLIEGRVLVVGGNSGTQDLATAEIFNPGSGAFEPVSTTLSLARAGHTALLLPHNAGVLIAGGATAGASVTAADLFLPAIFPDPYSWGTGSFAPTGAMTAARSFAVSGPAGDDGFAYTAGGGPEPADAYRFATIKTDKDDYAPGELAVITGSGWQPGEAVTLIFQEDPAVHEDYSFAVEADSLGNIYWDRWSPENHDLGVRFYLTAQGSQSRAQTTFTDAKGTDTLISSDLNPSTPGQQVTFTATVTENNSGGGTPGLAVSVGTISFREGGNNCNTGQGVEFATATPNASGQATATRTFATAGSSTIRACYNGTGGSSGTGNSNASLTQTVSGDTTAPMVVSITQALPSPTNASSVTWTVTFSESVTGVNAAGFSLAQSGLTGSPAITGVSGSGSTYTVSASTGNGTGTLGLNLNDDDSIVDAAANKLGGTGTGVAGGGGAGNGSAAGAVYSLDRTLTAVVTVANKVYDGTVAATILTRSFSSALAVTESVQVTGGSAAFADADADTGKTVTVTGLGLSGTASGKYVLSSTTATPTANITPAPATVSVPGYSVEYDGQPHGLTGTATGVGGADLSGSLTFGAPVTDVPGGSITWTFNAGANYQTANGSATVTITPATATISVPNYTVEYDGEPHELSGSATGAGGANLGGFFVFGPAVTNVPGGSITWTFDAGANYHTANGSATVTITPATATIGVPEYSVEYDGQPHGLSGTATGVGGANLASFFVFGPAVTNVPGGSITWTFDAGANYVTANGSATVTITPATAIISVADYTVEYNAQPHGLSGSATGVGGAHLASFLSFGAPVTDVPGGPITWTFDAGANYVTANGSATVTITPATATIAVSDYSVEYNGQSHGLSGSATGVGGADLAGFLMFGAPVTDVPGGSIAWTFNAGANYVTANGNATVTITPATATINVPAYSVEYDSQPHALSGTATGVGGVNLASSLNFGAPVTDAPGGSIDWSFDAGANYATATGSTTVTITARPLTVTATGVNRSYNGTTNASVTLTDDRLAGDVFTVSYGSASFATKHVGYGKPIAVNGIAISGPDAGNYAANTTATASAEISAAGLTIAAVTDSRVYDGTVASAGVPTVGAVFTGDTVTGVAQTFDTRHVGTGKTLSVTSYTVNDGNNGHNYMVALLADHLGVITQRALSVSGVTANNKPFDGNTSATLNLGAAALVGVIAPDAVSLNTAGATGTFASSAVGTWTVAVSGLTLGDTNAGNYSLTQPTASASITAWTLSGFFQPVGIPNTYPGVPAAPSVWNTIKGGQTVPLKFELFASSGGTELTSVTDVTGFTLAALPCYTGLDDPLDPDFTTTGSTVLRYTDGQFIQNWDSPKGAGRCYRVTMTARDGSQLSAFFKTK